jgi:hypothetical protein
VELNKKPKCTVLSVFPKTEFVKNLGISICGEADLTVEGKWCLPEMGLTLLPEQQALGAAASMRYASQASVVGRLSLSLISTKIQVIGVGDNESTWLFERQSGSHPLLGDQTVMQVVLAPKNIGELEVAASVFANVSTYGFVATRLTGPSIRMAATMSE